MSDDKLFGGIVVVIDDDVENNASSVSKLIKQVKKAHCPVLAFPALPSPKELRNLRAASFFVVDWNLHNPPAAGTDGVPGVNFPAGLTAQHRQEILDFLKELKATKFSPIFIFTDAVVEDVKNVLLDAGIITGSPNDHVFVMSKSKVVKKGLNRVLADWVKKVPSAYVLKKWELEYERAKNEMFIDFYTNSPLWPLIFWKAFKDDGVPEAHEMGALIGRNVVSRISQFALKLKPALLHYAAELSAVDENSRAVVKKVIEGERFIPKTRLPANSISPGDLFKKQGDYYLNIRPDCDCIPRDGKSPNALKLYLLRGSKLTQKGEKKQFMANYGHFSEHAGEAVVFGVDGGKTVSFSLKNLIVQSWGTWKSKRVGRLVGPNLIGVQQRYAGYLQRPGAPRIPGEAIPS